MSLVIHPETTVGALLAAYPQAESVLIEMAPAFEKLRNPLLRRTVAKVATLEQAARIGGVSLQVMVLRLRELVGQGGAEIRANGSLEPEGDADSWLVHGRVVEEIDADAMLERGVHPIGRIREAVKTLGPGEVIALRSSFRPQPLIETMRRSGLAVRSVPDGPIHVTHFGKRP